MDKKEVNIIKDWVLPIGIAVVVALLIRQFIIYKVYIPSGSMIPTIEVHDQLLVTKVYNKDKLKRGDIIVFKSREFNDTFIKRLIGLPGDEIKISNGEVFVNGEKVEEDYVKNNDFDYKKSFKVPEGKYFFLGDNRSNSNDARYWKNPYISGDDIEGKAQLRVYPFSRFGFIE